MSFDGQRFLAMCCEGGPAMEQAARDVTKHYQPRLRRWYGMRLRNANDIDDLVNSVLLKTCLNAPKLRDPNKLHGWIIKTATNELIDHLRKSKVQTALFQSLEDLRPTDLSDDQDIEAFWLQDSSTGDPMVWRCIEQQLTRFAAEEPGRYACISARFLGDDMVDVADVLGRTEHATDQYWGQSLSLLLRSYLSACMNESNFQHLKRGHAKFG